MYARRWRDRRAAGKKRFADNRFPDDLEFSGWDLSYKWIRWVTDARAEVYPIPFFHNYVGGQIADWMVGGAPGEDVQTYLRNCPNISFIGVNSYFCADWRTGFRWWREAGAAVTGTKEASRSHLVGPNVS